MTTSPLSEKQNTFIQTPIPRKMASILQKSKPVFIPVLQPTFSLCYVIYSFAHGTSQISETMETFLLFSSHPSYFITFINSVAYMISYYLSQCASPLAKNLSCKYDIVQFWHRIPILLQDDREHPPVLFVPCSEFSIHSS